MRRLASAPRPPATRRRRAPYPDKVASPEYPEGVEVRRVRSNGEVKWEGERVFVGEALIGEPVTPSGRYPCIRASVTHVSGRTCRRLRA